MQTTTTTNTNSKYKTAGITTVITISALVGGYAAYKFFKSSQADMKKKPKERSEPVNNLQIFINTGSTEKPHKYVANTNYFMPSVTVTQSMDSLEPVGSNIQNQENNLPLFSTQVSQASLLEPKDEFVENNNTLLAKDTMEIDLDLSNHDHQNLKIKCEEFIELYDEYSDKLNELTLPSNSPMTTETLNAILDDTKQELNNTSKKISSLMRTIGIKDIDFVNMKLHKKYKYIKENILKLVQKSSPNKNSSPGKNLSPYQNKGFSSDTRNTPTRRALFKIPTTPEA